MSEPKLKPCPTCGSSNVKGWTNGAGSNEVRCDDCYLSTRSFPTEEEAVAAWNTRPLEDEMYRALKDFLETVDEPTPGKVNIAAFIVSFREAIAHYEGRA